MDTSSSERLRPGGHAELEEFLSMDYHELFSSTDPAITDAVNMVGTGNVTSAMLELTERHRIRSSRTIPRVILPHHRERWVRTRIQMDTGAQTNLVSDPSTVCATRSGGSVVPSVVLVGVILLLTTIHLQSNVDYNPDAVLRS